MPLKLAEGKGFSADAIRSLLKKELHMPTEPLDLKENLQHVTVLHSLFNGSGNSTG